MILNIDARELSKYIEPDSVNCCVTSPPYYGLRDYGTAEWEGGDPNCEHTISGWNDNMKPGVNRPERDGKKRQLCIKCGAQRIDRQLGLEETPEEYVENLVNVFREVWRVMKDDGTLWLNIGDSYASQKTGDTYSGFNARYHGLENNGGKQAKTFENVDKSRRLDFGNLKPKDLIGIPWRVAFALQADGWYLRQDIIWHKPNPMPESVKDRCTKSHEYIFLLSKSAKYYYDNEAIIEPVSEVSLKRAEYGWDCDRDSTKNASMGGSGIHTEKMGSRFVNPKGRNKRSVWTVNTKPHKFAHFAVYPEELIEPCILAGCPVGGTVLDPFSGSGTTGRVAIRNRRKYIGCELNPEYITIQEDRLKTEMRMF